jgi:GDP-mannose 6-dehydrogenase
MKIAIFGLGYVGAVSAACLADAGHQVVGVDINPTKVELINQGQSPVVESGLAELIAQTVSSGHLRATTNPTEALREAQLSLICVGTPDKGNGSPLLAAVSQTCRDIGRYLPQQNIYHVVVMRSTILPGTTDKLVMPTLQEASGLRAGQDFGVCFNPEFLREGSSIYDFHHPPFTVIGAYEDKTAAIVAEAYRHLNAPVIQTAVKTAEMVKFVSNAFHALKITFANEIGNICKQHHIDSHEVMDIFCRDDKLNISPAYLKPGFAFGGSCLPKDLRALLYLGRHLDMSLPVLEAILPSNEVQIKIALDMIAQAGKKRVGVLGFSFKAGTDDLRYSPQVELIERLIGKGYQVKLFDRNVSLARLHGANKAYIESEIPHIATLMCATAEEVLADSELIVIGNRDERFADVLQNLPKDQVVIDLVRISNEMVTSLDHQYRGICW